MSKAIWVVEMWNDERYRWEPTVGVGLTRSDAETERREWRRKNPSDRFCIVRYAPRLAAGRSRKGKL